MGRTLKTTKKAAVLGSKRTTIYGVGSTQISEKKLPTQTLTRIQKEEEISQVVYDYGKEQLKILFECA